MLIRKLKLLAISLFIAFSGSLMLVPAMTASAETTFKGDACAGVGALEGTNGSTCPSNGAAGINSIIRLVLNVLSIIVGITAVIMVILGGFKFVTSNGDSSNIASARNTIIYALVGLIIVIFAQVMVHFVVGGATTALKTPAAVKKK